MPPSTATCSAHSSAYQLKSRSFSHYLLVLNQSLISFNHMRLLIKFSKLLIPLLFLTTISRVWSYSRCSACNAVMKTLVSKLDSELPRNSIDTRHRLAADGTRYGKVIEWKLSELRIIELLEDLCDKFAENYILNDEEEWIVGSSTSTGEAKEALKQQRRYLKGHCGDLIDRYEQQLSKVLQDNQLSADEIQTHICVELSKQCEMIPPVAADEL